MLFISGVLSKGYKCPNNFNFAAQVSSDWWRGNIKWTIKAASGVAIWDPQREYMYKLPQKRPERRKACAGSFCLKVLSRLPECVDCKMDMIHTGYGPVQTLYFVLKEHRWGGGNQNKTKTVVNNKACHWPAKTQANLSLEEKQIISTLNYPRSGHGPTYLVSH